MPIIREDGEELQVTPRQLAVLVQRGLVARCDCGAYHHEEYERWEEIQDLLRAQAACFGPPDAQPPSQM